MKILITGGNGFIARNLFEQLKDDYSVFSVNRQELNLLNSSEVFDYLRKNEFNVVIHAATYDAAPKHSTKNPAKVLENNLKMFFNLARCKDYFDKMIYFGSGAEYDREHWKPRMKEGYFDQYVPMDQYGLSKYVMTKCALSNNKIINLRLFAVFGKYDDWQVRIISNICHSAAYNLPIAINQNKYYDFLHIDDLVKIVKWFINNKPREKVYNVCTGNVIDFKTLTEKIIKISGKKLEIIIKTKELGKEYSGDNTLLLSELKDFEFISPNDAIKELYDWYNQKREDPNDNK
tara:strand:- start:2510 stop:3379 length:870 start_codon:yes stop_codon:yes gene_type:complete